MLEKILISTLVLAFGGLALYFARKTGYKSAESDFLKEQIKNDAKEKQRASKIIDNVRRMSSDDVSERLQNITKNNK